MKKIKFLGAAVLAASLIFAGCANGSDDEDYSAPETPAVENPTDSGDGTDQNNNNNGGDTNNNNGENNNGGNNGGNNNGGDNGGNNNGGDNGGNNNGSGENGENNGSGEEEIETGSASDLASYVYHKSIIASLADPWGSGTDVTVTDGKATMVSGNLWGAGGVCGVSSVEFGELADYEYIVFTVDTSSYTISAPLEDLSKNTGVNVKVPEIIKRPTKWFTENGKRTYYMPTSEFSNASTATSIALIIGGEGTLVVEDFYLAATEEPAAHEVVYENATIYEKGIELSKNPWWGTWTCEVEDGNLVSTGSANGCFGLSGFTPVPFKEGAKLEVTYKANQAWAVKPVAPNAETPVAAADDFTTITVDLGTASNLTEVGIVHKADNSEIIISSIRVIDNE